MLMTLSEYFLCTRGPSWFLSDIELNSESMRFRTFETLRRKKAIFYSKLCMFTRANVAKSKMT